MTMAVPQSLCILLTRFSFRTEFPLKKYECLLQSMMFTSKFILDRPLSVSLFFSFTHKYTFWQHHTKIKIELSRVFQTIVKLYKASNRQFFHLIHRTNPIDVVLATKKEKLVKPTKHSKDLIFCFKLQSRDGTKQE